MYSQFAGWQFKNMSRVLRSVFSCDSAAVASYPHQENEEGEAGSTWAPLQHCLEPCGSGDGITPSKMGPYLVLQDSGGRRPC